MLNYSKEDIAFIKNNFKNADKILKEKDVNNVLDVLYDFIDINGFDENEDYNDLGREAQKVYDSIYLNN